MDAKAQLVAEVEDRLRPLEVSLGEAWWEASTRSSDEADRAKAQIDLERRAVLADPDAFAAIRDARAAVNGSDPAVRRQLELLFDAFAPHQVPADLRRRLVELETAVDSTYNQFRGDLDGQPVDNNTILEILRSSRDTGLRRRAWEASKQIGAEVADRVRELARLRNEAARAIGARDHFALALETGELDEGRLFATLDEVDRATAAPFAAWKAELDGSLAARFGCAVGELRPWHFDDPFFQDPPADGAVDLDPLFAKADLEALTMRTYDGLGLDLRAVLANSDLYARAGKSQHAFCIDIDREGDVRVLCNLEPNERWTETMLHEFGHAVYDRNLDRDLPWLVRMAAHSLTTEGIAMLFGRLVRDPAWLGAIPGVDTTTLDELRPQLERARRASLLTFARWVLVVTNFERRLYADPDADLDTIWWDLVERYQLVRRARGPSRARLGRQDPPRRRARLLPELSLRGARRVAARRHPHTRASVGSSTSPTRAVSSSTSSSRRALPEGGTGSSRTRPANPSLPGSSPASSPADGSDTVQLGLSGRATVVAGGTRGVGRSSAELLAAEGARVAVLARDETELRDTEEALVAAGAEEALGLQCDLLDTGEVEAAFSSSTSGGASATRSSTRWVRRISARSTSSPTTSGSTSSTAACSPWCARHAPRSPSCARPPTPGSSTSRPRRSATRARDSSATPRRRPRSRARPRTWLAPWRRRGSSSTPSARVP